MTTPTNYSSASGAGAQPPPAPASSSYGQVHVTNCWDGEAGYQQYCARLREAASYTDYSQSTSVCAPPNVTITHDWPVEPPAGQVLRLIQEQSQPALGHCLIDAPPPYYPPERLSPHHERLLARSPALSRPPPYALITQSDARRGTQPVNDDISKQLCAGER